MNINNINSNNNKQIIVQTDPLKAIFDKADNANDLQSAFTLFKRLKFPVAGSTVERQNALYNHLIHLLVVHKHYDKAVEVFHKGLAEGLMINQNSLLKLCHMAGENAAYRDILSEATNLDNTDPKFDVTKCMNAFAHVMSIHEPEEAHKVYKVMLERGMVPDDKTYKILWAATTENLRQPIEDVVTRYCVNYFANRQLVNYSPSTRISADKIKRIQESRVAGSHTIKTDAAAFRLWQNVDNKVRYDANNKDHVPDLHWIRTINRKLGGDNGGVLRSGDVRVTAGGRNEYEYAPPARVADEMNTFVDWLQYSLKECDAGRRNPIVVAARAFQRLVSIHAFCDRNGRTSRLVMDYVLIRYKLPPAAIGDDVCLAQFSLNGHGKTPSEAVRAVLGGVQRSYAILNG